MPNVKTTIDTAAATGAVDNIRLTVRGLLAVREMTALELAKILGLNRTPIYDRLRGVKPFTTEEVALMSTLFGVPVQAFFDGPDRIFAGDSGRGTLGSNNGCNSPLPVWVAAVPACASVPQAARRNPGLAAGSGIDTVWGLAA